MIPDNSTWIVVGMEAMMGLTLGWVAMTDTSKRVEIALMNALMVALTIFVAYAGRDGEWIFLGLNFGLLMACEIIAVVGTLVVAKLRRQPATSRSA